MADARLKNVDLFISQGFSRVQSIKMAYEARIQTQKSELISREALLVRKREHRLAGDVYDGVDEDEVEEKADAASPVDAPEVETSAVTDVSEEKPEPAPITLSVDTQQTTTLPSSIKSPSLLQRTKSVESMKRDYLKAAVSSSLQRTTSAADVSVCLVAKPERDVADLQAEDEEAEQVLSGGEVTNWRVSRRRETLKKSLTQKSKEGSTQLEKELRVVEDDDDSSSDDEKAAAPAPPSAVASAATGRAQRKEAVPRGAAIESAEERSEAGHVMKLPPLSAPSSASIVEKEAKQETIRTVAPIPAVASPATADYTEEERQEFEFLVEQGFNEEEAHEFIERRRVNLMTSNAPTSTVSTPLEEKEIVPLKISSSAPQTLTKTQLSSRQAKQSSPKKSVRVPVRLDHLSGDRAADIELLISRGYDRQEASELWRQMFPSGPPPQPAVTAPNNDSRQPPYDNRAYYASGRSEPPPSYSHGPNDGFKTPPYSAYPPAVNYSMDATSKPTRRYSDSGSAEGSPSKSSYRVDIYGNRNIGRVELPGTLQDSDTEALRLGLIISQQEAQFGVNMYDSLLPTDESQIEYFVNQGFTLDEAVLMIFENRFGKIKEDPLPTLPTRQDRSKAAGDDQSVESVSRDKKSRAGVDMHKAENVEAEIRLLMVSGYSREEAVKILLERSSQSQEDDDVSTSTWNKASPNKSSTGRKMAPLRQPSSLEPSAAPRPGYTSTFPTPVPASQPPPDSDNMSYLSMESFYGHQQWRTNPPPPGMAMSGSGMTPLPSPMPHGAMPPGAYMPPSPAMQSMYLPQHAQMNMPMYEPQLPANTLPAPRFGHLPMDERALLVGMLISQQDAAFRTNMFESLTAEDQMHIERIMGAGYCQEDAMLIVFEWKYGPLPPPGSRPLQNAGRGQPPTRSAEDLHRALQLSEQEYQSNQTRHRPGAMRAASVATADGAARRHQ